MHPNGVFPNSREEKTEADDRACTPSSDADDDYEVIGNCDVISVTTDGCSTLASDDGRRSPVLRADADDARCTTPTHTEQMERLEASVMEGSSETPIYLPKQPIMVASFVTKTSGSPASDAKSMTSTIDPHMEFVTGTQTMADSQRIDQLEDANIAGAVEARHRSSVGLKQSATGDEVLAMKAEIERLTVQLAAKHAVEDEYEQEREESRKYRRALDETIAKLMTREDEVNHYRQLHNKGYEDVSLPDTQYEALLEEKSREIVRLHEETKKLRSNYEGEKEKAAILTKELQDMNGLMKIVNDQRREDNDYIVEVRRIYEQRIKLMQDELTTMRLKTPRDSCATPTNCGSHGDMEFVCPQCSVHIEDLGMFNRHITVCAAKPEVAPPTVPARETGEPSAILL